MTNHGFAAERTLGKLTKWLRLLGFDAIFELDVPDDFLFEALKRDRILLTRTERVRDKYSYQRLIFIESNDPKEQLSHVIRELGIVEADMRPFSRCLRCNVEITEVEKDLVYGRVPDYIWETHDRFQNCPMCRRIYWPGSHTKRSMKTIREFFD